MNKLIFVILLCISSHVNGEDNKSLPHAISNLFSESTTPLEKFACDKKHNKYVGYSYGRKTTKFNRGHNKGYDLLGRSFSENSFYIGYRPIHLFSIEGGYGRLWDKYFEREVCPSSGPIPLLSPILLRSKIELDSLFIKGLFYQSTPFNKLEVIYGGGLKFIKGRFEQRTLRLGNFMSPHSKVVYNKFVVPYFTIGLQYDINRSISIRPYYGFEKTNRIKFTFGLESTPSVWFKNSHVIGIDILIF